MPNKLFNSLNPIGMISKAVYGSCSMGGTPDGKLCGALDGTVDGTSNLLKGCSVCNSPWTSRLNPRLCHCCLSTVLVSCNAPQNIQPLGIWMPLLQDSLLTSPYVVTQTLKLFHSLFLSLPLSFFLSLSRSLALSLLPVQVSQLRQRRFFLSPSASLLFAN